MKRNPMLLNSSCIVYESGVEIDADGSPNAYNSQNTGLDYLGNAGSSGNWYGIACDTSGNPFKQANGNYVSTTALQNHNKVISDPMRYVDSEKICYISVASDLIKNFGIHMADFGVVYNRATSKMAYCICADVGPRDKYGEISIKAAETIGVNSSPKHGGCDSGIVTIIFLNSNRFYPIDQTTINNFSNALLVGCGGISIFI